MKSRTLLALVVLVALSSVGCIASVLATLKSAVGQERTTQTLAAEIEEAVESVNAYLEAGKASRGEAISAYEALSRARKELDAAGLGLTHAVVGLGSQTSVSRHHGVAASEVARVNKLFRIWSTREGGPSNAIPVPR